jgi:hypothetical protein
MAILYRNAGYCHRRIGVGSQGFGIVLKGRDPKPNYLRKSCLMRGCTYENPVPCGHVCIDSVPRYGI